jgi:pilus assembly protein CpaF
LETGARISVVLPPLAVDGVHVAIRRFASRPLALDAFGPPAVVDRLRAAVAARANIVVFGATGAGKTSLVTALASTIDPADRVITIEDAAELRVDLPHVVRLEARPDNGDGAGRVGIRALVRAALRLRPDRIVVGEVRGPEALDMVWAMATGHDGSLSTCHAKSAADVLARLETFVLLADAALPLSAVRSQVRSAVDLVVGVERDGAARRVTSVHRVVDDPTHPSGVEAVVVARA